LIGAIVLVVLAVVFVPMILDSEPRQKRPEPSLEIPPKDKVAPLPPPAPTKASTTTPAPVVTKSTEAAPPAKAGGQQPIAQAAPELVGFAIQVGAFKEEPKLQQAHEKLAAARIPHYVERRGDLNRLRAGPYPSREAAEKALTSIKAASLDGQIVPLP
jgi:DedD protein